MKLLSWNPHRYLTHKTLLHRPCTLATLPTPTLPPFKYRYGITTLEFNPPFGISRLMSADLILSQLLVSTYYCKDKTP